MKAPPAYVPHTPQNLRANSVTEQHFVPITPI